jgi:hypothetical protein
MDGNYFGDEIVGQDLVGYNSLVAGAGRDATYFSKDKHILYGP